MDTEPAAGLRDSRDDFIHRSVGAHSYNGHGTGRALKIRRLVLYGIDLLHLIHGAEFFNRTAPRLLPGVRATSRIRIVESEFSEMAGGCIARTTGRADHRRPRIVGAVPVTEKIAETLVDLVGSRDDSVYDFSDARQPRVDRAPVQRLRPHAGQTTRSQNPGSGRALRNS